MNSEAYQAAMSVDPVTTVLSWWWCCLHGWLMTGFPFVLWLLCETFPNRLHSPVVRVWMASNFVVLCFNIWLGWHLIGNDGSMDEHWQIHWNVILTLASTAFAIALAVHLSKKIGHRLWPTANTPKTNED